MTELTQKEMYFNLRREKTNKQSLIFPEKASICENILKKPELCVLDIIKINQIIFEKEDKEIKIFNSRHSSYDQESILRILKYQKQHNCSNNEISLHFNLSRNTIAKWKKIK